jgi:hypothetical protein
MEARRLWTVAGVGSASAFTLAIVATVVSADVADKPAAASESPQNLEMKYAEAQYKLAETNLRKVELTNQRFQKTVSASVIADYTEDLAIAKSQLDGVREGGHDVLFAGWIRRVESNLKTAEASYNSARLANQRQPGTVDALDVERMRLRVEIARLQLEQGKMLASATVDERLRWQVQVLNDEVASLKVQTSRIAPQTRVYPWRY